MIDSSDIRLAYEHRIFVSSTTDGVTTKYAYDAAGRLVKEGTKTYRYGYLDKVLSVTDGKDKYTYGYHVDGQLASANYGNSSEDFLWDGLALVKRGGENHWGQTPQNCCKRPVCVLLLGVMFS